MTGPTVTEFSISGCHGVDGAQHSVPREWAPVELHFRRHHLKGSTDVIHINSEESKDRA